jgi:hypothetical protein
MTFEKILPQLIKLTADVGKVIMSFYKADMAVEMKLNKTPLTIARAVAMSLNRHLKGFEYCCVVCMSCCQNHNNGFE